MKNLRNSRAIVKAMDLSYLKSTRRFLELYIRKLWMFQKLMKAS
jgi:hypothetical protein